MSYVIPVNKHLLLKVQKSAEKTPGGIVLPEKSQHELNVAEVVNHCKDVEIDVVVGDRVVFKAYAGTKVDIDGEEYLAVEAKDVIAVVAEDE